MWNIIETRVLITNGCNYRCIFCHNEGSGEEKRHETDRDKLFEAIHALIANGCRDITFTGGEPLLQVDDLFAAIRFVRECDRDLPVTVVTNASLLKPHVSRFAEFGGVRFNVSFHATEQEEYRRLTGQTQFTLDDLREVLADLRECFIPFKMNSVVLHRSMPDTESVTKMIRFARSNGARACKLIELLIVKENRDLYTEFLAIESIEKLLPKEFEFFQKTERAIKYADPEGFIVELQKCRCNFGCEQCLKNTRVAALDNRGNYWACFAAPDAKRHLCHSNFSDVIESGERLMENMFDLHGKRSPSLNQAQEMVEQDIRVWFEIRSDKIIDEIERDFSESGITNSDDIFLEPMGDASNWPTVILHRTEHDPRNAALIIADISLRERKGLPENHICFFDKSGAPIRGDMNHLERLLAKLGWEKSFAVTIKERRFKRTNVRVGIQKVGMKRFLFVHTDCPNAIAFARELAGRDLVKPLFAAYRDIMASTLAGECPENPGFL